MQPASGAYCQISCFGDLGLSCGILHTFPTRARARYLVPKSFGEYLGVKFDKKFAHDALKLWSSSATDLEEYLGPAAIENAPKVGEWLESKGKTYGSKLRKMRMARFQGYIEEDHAKSYRKKAGGSRWSNTGSRRVRHRSPSLSDSGPPLASTGNMRRRVTVTLPTVPSPDLNKIYTIYTPNGQFTATVENPSSTAHLNAGRLLT
ncbi:hypothetical protein B0H11DRAFT_1916859 [Mycena galericulata]|nr:hypothetical protein B0H11DRAFT_1916859 [Mycena galericulata]